MEPELLTVIDKNLNYIINTTRRVIIISCSSCSGGTLVFRSPIVRVQVVKERSEKCSSLFMSLLRIHPNREEFSKQIYMENEIEIWVPGWIPLRFNLHISCLPRISPQ